MSKLKDKSLDDLLNRSVAEYEPTAYKKKMIRQRLELYKASPGKIKKWEEVKADIELLPGRK